MLPLNYSDRLKKYKPQKAPAVAYHTPQQALEKVLAMQSVMYVLQHSTTYNQAMETMTLELLKKICITFAKHQVEYIIVGGTSVGYHGYSRPSHISSTRPEITTDLDFWCRPCYENRMRIIAALRDMPFIKLSENNESEITIFQDLKFDDFMSIEQPNFKLDFLPTAPGLVFDPACRKN